MEARQGEGRVQRGGTEGGHRYAADEGEAQVDTADDGCEAESGTATQICTDVCATGIQRRGSQKGRVGTP